MTDQVTSRDETNGGRSRWLAAGAIIVCVIGMVALAGWAANGGPAFDAAALRTLRTDADPARTILPAWLDWPARHVSALGNILSLGLLAIGAAAVLGANGRSRAAVCVLLSAGGGWAGSQAIKLLVARPRPDVVPHLAHVGTASFPSGHAMLAAAVWLTLAAVAASALRRPAAQAAAWAGAVALVVAIGFSRVLLGVHYPTDVAGGWLAGAAWALACRMIVHGSAETRGCRNR